MKCEAAGEASFPRIRNGKLPLVRFENGNAYEGEWLNGKRHGRGIMTYANGGR
jgi:hypothetical protein